MSQALLKAKQQEAAEQLANAPELMGNRPDPDATDQLPINDAYTQTLIDEVLSYGNEFKAIYVKLSKLFDNIRPQVQMLKDNVFKVTQGSEGVEININGTMMDWPTFCADVFGVGTKRVNQLLEIKDRGHQLTSEPKKRVSMTEAEFEQHIAEAREEGKKNADPAGSLQEVLNDLPIPADDVYAYFDQFKAEPQTLGTEISAMLITLGLDMDTIKRVLEHIVEDADNSLCHRGKA